MSMFDNVRWLMGLGPSRELMSDDVGTVTEFLGRVTGVSTTRAYHTPSVDEALGVPSIHRAVALIASTTGMLSMQGFRNGEVMDGLDGRPESPRLITRPDPDQTPYAFYSMTAANMAKYGENVWWIANRDTDGLASALVNVPLRELRIQENPDDRRFPYYKWVDKYGRGVTGTRWSPARQGGQFVHIKYPLTEPFAIRGSGPLQICSAATSISIEAQAWAANFFGDGGFPREVITKTGKLDATLRNETTLLPDPDNGVSEADMLRSQWIGRPNNVPRVVDDSVKVDVKELNPQGAQMLTARQFQNGDAAREFGVPGSLLEYQEPGSSLTYQNLEGEFTKLIKVCLQPLYLEPIEQAMSDLLTRSTAARFNVKGFLRADIKTRYEVHGIAIDKGIYGPEYAQQEEGILPGDIEFAPIPFAPPAAITPTIPRAASLNVRCPKCSKLVARSLGAGSAIDCPRCKTVVAA